MKIALKLFASLASCLPKSCKPEGGGVPVFELAENSTLGDLLKILGIPPELSRITLVNGEQAGSERMLREGDQVSVFPPIAGG